MKGAQCFNKLALRPLINASHFSEFVGKYFCLAFQSRVPVKTLKLNPRIKSLPVVVWLDDPYIFFVFTECNRCLLTQTSI